MLDFYNKDWVNHFIIGIGVIIGIFIIIGFITSIRSVLSIGEPAKPVISNCKYCLNLQDNNTQSTVELGTDFMIELPEATYNKDNIVFVENPTGALRKTGFVTSNIAGYWRLQLKAASKGTN